MGQGATTAADLETWVRAEAGVPDEAEVAIAEKPGTDPRCAEMITVVTVTAPGEEPWTFHVEAALADMVPMDLVAALAFGGGH